MLQALEARGADVLKIPPVHAKRTTILAHVSRLGGRIFGYDLNLSRYKFLAKAKARALQKRLKDVDVDVVFAPVSSALVPYLNVNIPIIYVSDATVPVMLDYYPKFTGLTDKVIARSMELERKTLGNASLLVFPTRWAADSAVEHYGVEESKILVQPFGPNISDAPERENAVAPRVRDPVRLLFCGVEWERKGGPIAVNTLESLNNKGIDAELVVLGCTPPEDVKYLENVVVIPYLDKAIEAERKQLRDFFLSSDFLFVPTRAECFGMVFCEAAACGLPSITTATGGTSEVVKENITGFTLPIGAAGEDYATLIKDILETPGKQDALRMSARTDFETRLNWNSWADAILERIAKILANS